MKSCVIRKRFVLVAILVVLITTVSVRQVATHRAPPPWDEFCPAEGDQAVTDVLKSIREKYRVPALAGAIVTSKGMEVCGAVGVRKRGTAVPVTLDDKWYLASDTKAMTATLVGALVEQGLLEWKTTVAEIFPDVASTFDPEMKGITILQLLSHHAGLARDLRDLSSWPTISKRAALPYTLPIPAPFDVWSAIPFNSGSGARTTLEAQRRVVASLSLAEKRRFLPGTRDPYSNLGYIIVGAIIEKVTGRSFENAMQQHVFRPLEMRSAGFGCAGTRGQVDQPWGHTEEGRPAARNDGAFGYHPIQAASGLVHCSIRDWGRFLTDQLRGTRGASALLNSSTYQVLHTPPFGGVHALGWNVSQPAWVGGTVLSHAGDDAMNWCMAWIVPHRDLAVLVCVNQTAVSSRERASAFNASRDALMALISLHDLAIEGKGQSTHGMTRPNEAPEDTARQPVAH